MPLEYTFSCPLPNGIHARPASAIEEIARRFDAAIAVENCRTRQSANAKSVLGMVGLDIRLGDLCRVAFAGADERQALDDLSAFLEDVFPHCDDALPAIEAAPGVVLPRVLAEASAQVLWGTPVVPGIAEGTAVVIGAFAVPDSIPLEGASDRRRELERLSDALHRLTGRFDSWLSRAGAGIEEDLLRAHRSVARDPAFRQHLEDQVLGAGRTAAGAIASAERTFTAMLAATGSALLRERALDIRDVCFELLREAYGPEAAGQEVRLDGDSICLADSMTPGQFLALDARRLKGLVLGSGGTTSHTVILARSRGVPTLVGVQGIEQAALDGRPVVADAYLGVLVTGLTEPVRRYYALEHRRLGNRRQRQQFFAERPGATSDGRRVEIGANIATADEAARAFDAGAEGIGLFRTEMLFVDRESPPDEDTQLEAYRRAVAAAAGRPVIIRTLDVGGDKPLPYLRLPREENPFLGYRAVRIYPEFEALFRGQLRALSRASAFGKLRVMVPMVSRLEEASWTRSVLREEQQRLAREGVPFDVSMELGGMIEVPSAAFLVGDLAREFDFFSIGTNDLLQYFSAVDRANPRLAHLYAPAQPAFLRLLRKIVDDAHAAGRWVGVCGELGGERRYLPLLVGLGLDEISVAAPLIASTKADLAGIVSQAARDALDEAIRSPTSAAVEELLERRACGRRLPLVVPELVWTNGDARTKAEAIKEAVDRLYAAGRTDRPLDVEEAVWRREAVYSTGFGHGFAIPHCKTNAVLANSLAVLKLRAPVEWGSLDDRPVRVVILLAIRESDQATEHMRVLAALARRLMHDEFREQVEREADAAALCRFLSETVEESSPRGS